MNKLFLGLLLSFSLNIQAQSSTSADIYLFSYFKGNGEDGLHLAYSEDGYAWQTLRHDSSFLKPTAGKDKLMRDPCIIQSPDGTFHMVWTVSWNEKGIGYASSKDLIHWSEQQYIPVMEHEKDARNCWAPEIVYDSRSQQFMIYWATTITGRFTETQSLKENGYNHRIYYVTTKDFKTFSKTALLYNQGFNVIDATIVVDGKKYIMFLKDETIEPPQKNIRIATSNDLTKGYTKPGKPITGKEWVEGPTSLKINNQWIVYFDKYGANKMGAVTSSDLISWTDISDKVNFPSGTKHGTALKVSRTVVDKLK
ncbi:glycoside hydrolase family 43 protein [Ohtaekwangia koreensis]|uniref:Glycosyl hydrolases family 43 n=1 Tax=Ohtaekwangia koreensis TaxID=688867 RepID=A0A1T5MHP4_9BACT|nr:glycoside hydrolase family 43 protein [Ohtaekwangia koreensis]SKC87454.1 Glycosyl hydrolases family 43 [Ohtaekwangia koreensis]